MLGGSFKGRDAISTRGGLSIGSRQMDFDYSN